MSTHQTTAKRIANALLAAVLAIGLMVPTFALTSQEAYAAEITSTSGDSQWGGTDNAYLTIRNTQGDDSTYYLYQIFMGTESNGTLSDIQWGASIKNDATDSTAYDLSDELIDALRSDKASISFTVTSGSTSITYTSLGDYFTATLPAESGGTAQTYTAAQVAKGIMDANQADNSSFIKAFSDVVANVISAAKSNTTSPVDVEYMKQSTSSTTAGDDGTVTAWNYGFSGLHDGYYLVQDDITTAGSTQLNMNNIIELIGTEVVQSKGYDDTASKTKKTLVTDSGTSTTGTVAIGDTLNYRITSVVPNMSGYSNYTFVLYDEMSKGASFKQINSITIGTTEVKLDTVVNDPTALSYTVKYYSPSASGTYKYDGTDTTATAVSDSTAVDNGMYRGPVLVEITFNNLLAYTGDYGDTITVNYSALVNDEMRTGTDLTNSVRVRHSNNRSNPSDTVTSTPADGQKVDLDTGGINLTKTDMSGNRLTGSKWKIEGTALNTVVDVTYSYEPTSDLTYDKAYYLEHDGAYTTNPELNGKSADPNDSTNFSSFSSIYKATPVQYTISDTGTGTADTAGKYGTKQLHSDSPGSTIYVKRLNNDNTFTYVQYAEYSDSYTYEMEYVTYKQTVGADTYVSGTENYVANIETDDSGRLLINGLKAGTYTITETTPPTGNYDVLDHVITLVVSLEAKKDSEGNVTGYEMAYKVYKGSDVTDTAEIKYDENITTYDTDRKVIREADSNGKVVLRVGNGSLSDGSLPSTGGIGTTIFYIVGGLLVAGAVVYLVTRRRMKAERE